MDVLFGISRNTESQTEDVEGGGELTALPARIDEGKDGTKESALPASAETRSKRRAVISPPPLQMPSVFDPRTSFGVES